MTGLRFICFAFVLLVANTLAHPSASVKDDNGFGRICQDYRIPVHVSSENLVSNFTVFKNNFELIDFITDFTRKDGVNVTHPFRGVQNATSDYFVSGTFCSPKTLKGGHEKTVLLTTHGLGYDRRYWDSAYKPSEYNFVDAAINAGFSIFYYDRLGTGTSQKISGFTNQASIQVQILKLLAQSIRQGSYTGQLGKPKSVVLVGHSFGSLLSQLLVGGYPDIVDGVVLTGLGYDAPDYSSKVSTEAFAPRIARLLDQKHFQDLDTGYITFADIYAHVNTFFKAPYEVGAVQYAQSISQPFAVAEYFALPQYSLDAHNFQGPVLVTTGEFDYLVCGGECYSSFATPYAKIFFSGSKALETYVHPGAGHGINFSKNATGFYQVITDFLIRQAF